MTDLTDSDVEDVVCGFGNGRLRRGPASASGDIVRSRKRVRVDDEDDGVVGYSYEKAFYEWLVLEPCGMKIERLVKDANILRDLDAHFGIALPDSAATYEELARLALQQNSDKDQSARTFEHLESVPPGRKDETLLIKMVRAKNLWEVERTVDNKGMSKNRVLFCGQPAKITEAAMKTMKVLTTEFVERGFLHGITSADLATRSSKDVFDLLNKLKGIGPYTINTFMIDVLKKTDVVNYADLDVKKGLAFWLGKEAAYFRKGKEQEMREYCERWGAQRSLGSTLMALVGRGIQGKGPLAGLKGKTSLAQL